MNAVRVTRWRLLLALCLATTVSADEYWRHPGNARAAASCAHLFADTEAVEDASFFAELSWQEDLAEPEARIAEARMAMKRGHGFSQEAEAAAKGNAERAGRAARIRVRGAGDLLRAGKPYREIGLELRRAIDLDPSVATAARAWAFTVTRARITASTSPDLLSMLSLVSNRSKRESSTAHFVPASDPELAGLEMEIAIRAYGVGWTRIAAAYATQAAFFDSPHKPFLARILVLCARRLLHTDRELSGMCILSAIRADPRLAWEDESSWIQAVTTACGRRPFFENYLSRFPKGRYAALARTALRGTLPECEPSFEGRCLVGESPFWRQRTQSDARLFPAASCCADPIPVAPLPALVFERRATACRALAPPLFPEPFDGHRMGVQSHQRIYGEEQPSEPESHARPCVAGSTYHMVIGRDGRVESARVLSAYFEGEDESAAALAAETRGLTPILLAQRYEPARIRGVAVRSSSRGGYRRNCDE